MYFHFIIRFVSLHKESSSDNSQNTLIFKRKQYGSKFHDENQSTGNQKQYRQHNIQLDRTRQIIKKYKNCKRNSKLTDEYKQMYTDDFLVKKETDNSIIVYDFKNDANLRRKNRQISTDNKNDPADIHNDTIIIDESSEEEEESKNNISDCDSSIFNFIVNC